jgi:hypothetical protein
MQIENSDFEEYPNPFLIEKYRPPSKGGNTKALHRHAILIAGCEYSFLANGARKWAFIGDTICFDWQWDETRKYRNIDPSTFVTKDKNGIQVERGFRGSKKMRTAEARMPVSRREQRA